MIRTSAKIGDLIFGFAANKLDETNRLLYVAKITDKLSDGAYFRKKRYASRGDCIYIYRLGYYEWKKNAQHHGPNDRQKDIGKPPEYPRACVLLSTDFRYFGANGTDGYKTLFPRIKRTIERLGRGHRVHHGTDLYGELIEMHNWLWQNSARKVLGQPTNKPSRDICHRGGTTCLV